MLARWIATVAALLLACAQAGAHVRTERVADLVDRADVATPLGELAQQSKTALPARASMESTASGQNASVSHWRVGENGTESEESTSATALWRWDSAPFGETAANENPTVGLPSFTYNLRFPGQQYDRETGTHYNYFRDYEAQAGRYVQSDPIGLFGGITTFTYTEKGAVLQSDPYGLSATAALRAGQQKDYNKNKPDNNGKTCNYCQNRDAVSTDHVVSVMRCLECVKAGKITEQDCLTRLPDTANLLEVCKSCNSSKCGRDPRNWNPPSPTSRAQDFYKNAIDWLDSHDC